MQNISFEFCSLLFDLVYIILVVKKGNINVCVLPSFLDTGPAFQGHKGIWEVLLNQLRLSWMGQHHLISWYNTFYTIWGTSQVFPTVYSVFTVVFVLTLQNVSHPQSNIQLRSSTELLRPGVSRPVVSQSCLKG